LPALNAAGLQFDVVSFPDWLNRLKSYRVAHGVEQASLSCPAVKLLDFWEHTYGGKKRRGSDLCFDTRKAQQASRGMRSRPDVIKTGLVSLMLAAWLKSWSAEHTKTAATT
jgi:hypothetical protein